MEVMFNGMKESLLVLITSYNFQALTSVLKLLNFGRRTDILYLWVLLFNKTHKQFNRVLAHLNNLKLHCQSRLFEFRGEIRDN